MQTPAPCEGAGPGAGGEPGVALGAALQGRRGHAAGEAQHIYMLYQHFNISILLMYQHIYAR